MTLEQMRKEIGELIKQKGWGNNYYFFPFKLFYAMLELAEAGEMWKKGKNRWQYEKWKNVTQKEWEDKIAEQLIDVIIYILDASRLGCPNSNMDKVFEEKLKKNFSRKYKYGTCDTYRKILEVLQKEEPNAI